MQHVKVAFVLVLALVCVGDMAAQNSWVQVVGPSASTPAGFGDTDNTMAMSSAVSDGELYVGTFNFMFGSEVWRSPDGNSWVQVNTDGFGGTDAANNVGSYSMIEFDGKVYAATWASGYPSSPGAPTKVWRYDDTPAWYQANSDGFGSVGNTEPWAMAVFPGDPASLYVGASNYANGAELWRAHNGVSWVNANDNGFGDPNNIEISAMEFFNGYLYAATTNETTGLEVWRTDVGFSIQANWNQVNEVAGFGGASHTSARAMAVFNGSLYLSTFSFSSGGAVYWTSDGTTWYLVAQSQNGFGDANNFGGLAMTTHDGALFLGSFNWTTGTEVWRTTDGLAWAQVNEDGFGVQKNYAVLSWSELGGNLYAMLRNDDGCEVYRMALFADDFESGGTTAWSGP